MTFIPHDEEKGNDKEPVLDETDKPQNLRVQRNTDGTQVEVPKDEDEE